MLESDTKFDEQVTFGFENDMKNLANFQKSTQVSKLRLLLGPFIQSKKCMTLKFTGELCIMTIKNDAKFEEELTCQFKADMKNLTNFELSTQKSKKFAH